ncbi:MAG: ROK family protein [Kiritimatiellaeota bacterium]|nr:ROK family protein [Kiritimatiellota bacterium]
MYVIGIDIGGTKIAVSLGTDTGEIPCSKRLDNKDSSPDDMLPAIVLAARELLESEGLTSNNVAAAGIGAPSPIDIPNGLITRPHNLRQWVDVPIRDFIARELGAETFFENDANAGALAEWMFGAGGHVDNMIYLTMSTGIGGGVIADGRLLHGASFLAGEVGHMSLDPGGPLCECGMKGCYEAFCGGRAVAKRMRGYLADKPDHRIVELAGGDLDKVDMPALRAAVGEGDAYALALWDEFCLRNAQAMGALINIFNPERVVLGTIALASGDMFLDPLKKRLPEFCWDETLSACQLALSSLGGGIAEYSGVCVALNGLIEKGDLVLSRV